MQEQFRQQNQRFEFTGKGWEYFRIWIVNLLLTILTLGIYSAWAKVRRLQYFYRNTRLADASFDYHGTPKAILKGRIIALGLLIAYNGAFQFNPLLGVVVALLLGMFMPWLLMRSLRFKLYNSSYRGLRFGFAGEKRGAYSAFLGYPALAGMTAYLLAPLAHQRIKKYQFDNSRFGSTTFRLGATVKGFYLLYLSALAVLVGTAIVASCIGDDVRHGEGAARSHHRFHVDRAIRHADPGGFDPDREQPVQRLYAESGVGQHGVGGAPFLQPGFRTPSAVDTREQFPRCRADVRIVHALCDHTHAALQIGVDGGGRQRGYVRLHRGPTTAGDGRGRRNSRDVRCRYLLLTIK